MSTHDPKEILDFYEDSFSKYGTDARSVHWSGEISQTARFQVLANIAPLENKRILDAGCGLGDLYKFFLTKKIEVDYFGIDIMPAFIARAKERFPEAHFELGDIASIQEQYDYIFASGALTIAADYADKDYYFEMIRVMFEHAKEGIAFNMLNQATYQGDKTYISYDIDEVTEYCKTLTDHVVVVSDYLPQDFTVYMYKK